MPALRLTGIGKTFPGGHVAVSGVDLDVGAGELVILLGPSGCGKSTLLRIVAGVEIPTAGRVLIDGRDVTDLPPQKRDVAMVFQNYALYPHMTVRENLAFGLRMRRVQRAAVDTRVGQVAENLGIMELLERKPAQLSGGQRQRVALGRAIARNPKLFLLDEPLSNLDVQLRVTTRLELARLHRSLRVPMLYVTHDQEEAITLGDRVAVMNNGRLLQVDTPMKIYAQPATRFVGGFVGSPRMNFFTADLRAAGDDNIEMTALDGALRLQLARGGDAGPHRPARPNREPEASRCRVTVGIRPEDIAIGKAPDVDLVGRVEMVEPLGREVLVHVVAGGAEGARATELRLLTLPETSVQVGSDVGLSLERERLHFFDPVSEKRLIDPMAGQRLAGLA
ncbi:MAG: ABC transporter ATP-binding protein [Candidatus Latescibacterota bacterium]|nr:MAG: ABC transporter ATP-binding protein [Candidatus Latescibacterota bacterium]